MKDAPFEQTFRVTVMLPKNQLYVERIGAKTKLVKLLDDICESKDLHRHKYEFRHPGDNSVVFDNEQTIGEVGLNELRLVLKTESRFNENFNRFHPNDMLRYKNTVSDSVSSSEISRESKLILRKSSPYSSSNSLNSLDSGGMGATTKVQPPVAPVRKKRAAPRPPSQNSIPEQETVSTNITVFKEPLAILPRKNFHVSSPSLFNNGYQHDHHRSNLSINNNENADNNNNKIQQQQREQQQQQEKRQQQKQSDLNMNRINATAYNANNRPTSMYILSDNNVQSGAATIDKRIAHHNSAMYLNRSRTSSESSEVKDFMGAKMSHGECLFFFPSQNHKTMENRIDHCRY
jgi:3D (Asp-Asp-Asp) domain-containing protein